MAHEQFEIVTERLLLRSWRITDRSDFASMNADGEVMADRYATEAATAALADAFGRRGSSEVLAYTAADNVRSQRVMERLGLQRVPALDFSQVYDGFGMWSGLVWVASAEQYDVDADA